MLPELPHITRERIAEIEALHQPVTQWERTSWFPWFRLIDVCVLCRQPVDCLQRRWAAMVKAGRRVPAGWLG